MGSFSRKHMCFTKLISLYLRRAAARGIRLIDVPAPQSSEDILGWSDKWSMTEWRR